MQQPRRDVTANLLKYYADLTIHHRLVMIGFLTLYFGINQAVFIASQGKSVMETTQLDVAVLIVSIGLLITFSLAAALHHACHFCSTTAIKAMLAAEMHFEHLPDKDPTSSMDFFGWVNVNGERVRQGLAVRSFSVYIIATLFALIAVANAVIFLEAIYGVLGKQSAAINWAFGAFVLVQIGVVMFYGTTFWGHYGYFQLAKRQLRVVITHMSRAGVEQYIRNEVHGGFPAAERWAELLAGGRRAHGDRRHGLVDRRVANSSIPHIPERRQNLPDRREARGPHVH